MNFKGYTHEEVEKAMIANKYIEEDDITLTYPSEAQIDALLEFLEQNPSIAKGQKHIMKPKKWERSDIWDLIADAINNMGPCVKNGNQWSKYWNGRRSRLKRRVKIYEDAKRAGLPVEANFQLTNIEQRMMALFDDDHNRQDCEGSEDEEIPMVIEVVSDLNMENRTYLFPVTSPSESAPSPKEYAISNLNSSDQTLTSKSTKVTMTTQHNSLDIKCRPSRAQLEVLVDFLEQNPGIAKGILRSAYAKSETKIKWETLAVTLNSIGGVVRDGRGWAKYWYERKFALKRRLSTRMAEYLSGDGSEVSSLSDIDKRMAALITNGEFAVMGSDVNDPLSLSHEESSDLVTSPHEAEYLSSRSNSPHSINTKPKSGENAQILDIYNCVAAKPRPSSAQLEVMVDFLEQNPKIAKGLMRTTQAKTEMKEKWAEAAVRINNAGDCIKDGRGWAKYWSDKKCSLKRRLNFEKESGAETHFFMSSLEERMAAMINESELATQEDADTNDPLIFVPVKSEKPNSPGSSVTIKQEIQLSPESENNSTVLNNPMSVTAEPKLERDYAEVDETQPILITAVTSLCDKLQSTIKFLTQDPHVAGTILCDAQTKKSLGLTPPINNNADADKNDEITVKKCDRSSMPVPRATSPQEHQTEDSRFTKNPHLSTSTAKSRGENTVAIESQRSRIRTISRTTKRNSRIRPRFYTTNDRLLAIEERRAKVELLRARNSAGICCSLEKRFGLNKQSRTSCPISWPTNHRYFE